MSPANVDVLERMILDVHGEPALARPTRSGTPRGSAQLMERAVALEAEVVVQPPCGMPLDDEDGIAALAPALLLQRLRRLARMALGLVLLQIGHRARSGGAHGRGHARPTPAQASGPHVRRAPTAMIASTAIPAPAMQSSR